MALRFIAGGLASKCAMGRWREGKTDTSQHERNGWKAAVRRGNPCSVTDLASGECPQRVESRVTTSKAANDGGLR